MRIMSTLMSTLLFVTPYSITSHRESDCEHDFGRDLSKQHQGENAHQVVADSTLYVAVELVLSAVDEAYDDEAKTPIRTGFVKETRSRFVNIHFASVRYCADEL